jgi:hypothetical protein
MSPRAGADDEVLTPAGVAALLFVDPKTVTRWARAGKLDAFVTPGGHRRYLKSDILAIISGVHTAQKLLPGRSFEPIYEPTATPQGAVLELGAEGVDAHRNAASVIAEAATAQDTQRAAASVAAAVATAAARVAALVAAVDIVFENEVAAIALALHDENAATAERLADETVAKAAGAALVAREAAAAVRLPATHG